MDITGSDYSLNLPGNAAASFLLHKFIVRTYEYIYRHTDFIYLFIIYNLFHFYFIRVKISRKFRYLVE